MDLPAVLWWVAGTRIAIRAAMSATFRRDARLLCCVITALAVADTARCHGGQYRGPGEVVPPAAAPSSSTGGAPVIFGDPQASGGGGATAGGNTPGGLPGGSGGARSVGYTNRGIPLDDDLTRWQYWWEFRKDRYLALKTAVRDSSIQRGTPEALLGATRSVDAQDRLAPSPEEVERLVIPALRTALRDADSRDLASGCMVALAKIGRSGKDWDLRTDVFVPFLASHDQEIRETAALCIGIAGRTEARDLELLRHLAWDTAEGRAATGRSQVDERTRTFAAYGIGLLAHAAGDAAFKLAALEALLPALDLDPSVHRNLMVAAVSSLGMLDAPRSLDGERMTQRAFDALLSFHGRDLGVAAQWVQAHAPSALASLAGTEGVRADRLRDRFAAGLRSDGRKQGEVLQQSCAIALGQLLRPWEDEKSPDAAIAESLWDVARNHGNQQVRYFATMALGECGGSRARTVLLAHLPRARTLDLPWVGLALGVMAHRRAAASGGTASAVDEELARALVEAMKASRNPGATSGLAVALGLSGWRPAGKDLRELLDRALGNDEEAGYACVGLGMLQDSLVRPNLMTLLDKSARRPELLQQVAVALGKLGDKAAAERLQASLAGGTQTLARLAAIASALGAIGDRRSIEPLCTMLADKTLTPLTRAFAAVALGSVCDKQILPWNSPFAAQANYRAAVETLTDGGCGILDIF